MGCGHLPFYFLRRSVGSINFVEVKLMCWKFVFQYAIFLLNPVCVRIPASRDIATRHFITTLESDVTYFQHIHLSGQASFLIKLSSFSPLCFFYHAEELVPNSYNLPCISWKWHKLSTVHIQHMSHYCMKGSSFFYCAYKQAYVCFALWVPYFLP